MMFKLLLPISIKSVKLKHSRVYRSSGYTAFRTLRAGNFLVWPSNRILMTRRKVWLSNAVSRGLHKKIKCRTRQLWRKPEFWRTLQKLQWKLSFILFHRPFLNRTGCYCRETEKSPAEVLSDLRGSKTPSSVPVGFICHAQYSPLRYSRGGIYRFLACCICQISHQTHHLVLTYVSALMAT